MSCNFFPLRIFSAPKKPLDGPARDPPTGDGASLELAPLTVAAVELSRSVTTLGVLGVYSHRRGPGNPTAEHP